MNALVKTVTLSVEDWEQILEAAESYRDCGPGYDQGWKSNELSRAGRNLDEALNNAAVHVAEPKGTP